MENKLGIGYISCDFPERVSQTLPTIPTNLGDVVIINSGCILPKSITNGYEVIESGNKKSVAVSKNKALRYLLNKGCDHIFLIEDDVKIKDPNVFRQYVKSAQASGIWHLNYALQKSFDKPPPSPRAKLNYDAGVKIAFYPNPTGAFQYFYRGIIKNVGYFDEIYINAFENIDYLYRVIEKGLHPPFWWFADIDNSDLYLENLEDCGEKSVLRTDENYGKNVLFGKTWFKDKFGVSLELVPDTDEKIAFKKVNNIKNKYAREILK